MYRRTTQGDAYSDLIDGSEKKNNKKNNNNYYFIRAIL